MKTTPDPSLNFQTLFEAVPGCYLILKPDAHFTIVAVSNSYLNATLTSRENILNKGLFEVFPDNPDDELATGTHNLRTSLERVIQDKKVDTMPVQKYDIRRPAEEGGGFEERYWSPINTPVLSENGDIDFIIHRVENVTTFMQLKQQKKEQYQRTTELEEKTAVMEAEIFNREKETQATVTALKQSEERYSQLTTLLPVGVFNSDPQGYILYTNPCWYEMTKLTLKMLEKKYWYEFIYTQDQEKIAQAWQQNKKQGVFKTEFRFVTSVGELKWALTHIMPEANSNGEIKGYIGTITDITERKQQEEQEKKQAQMLAEIDRAKTVFFSNISHELRTPLTLIISPLEDILTDNQQQERLWIVYRNALRLLKLVNSLLDFSGIEANKVKALYEPVNLPEVTQNLLGLFATTIEKANLKLIVDINTFAESVYIDRSMYEKIIFNLLSNALKFTFKGAIHVSLKKHTQHVELQIKDTGIGIAPNVLPHIFERFYRVEGAQGRSHEGSGIGLALVQELVKMHNGTIQVESQVDQGSTFTVTLFLGTAHLPAERIKTPETPALTASNIGKLFVEEATQWLSTETLFSSTELAEDHTTDKPLVTKAKVLIADDNHDICYYLKNLLQPFWEVEIVHDGEAALHSVQQKIPDLILSDVMMPKIDGFQLIQQLKAENHTRFIPIILLSARAGEEARVEGLQAGADDYLPKPFFAKELVARIKIHMELGKLRIELEKKVAERTQALTLALKQTEEQQQKRAEEAEIYKKRQEQFIDTLCHEVRNPLNGAYSSTSLLKDTLELLEKLFKVEEGKSNILQELKKAKQQIDTIDQCTKQQKNIVDDVLNLSKLENNSTSLNYSLFELGSFLTQTLKMFDAQITEKKLTLQMHCSPSTIWLKADVQRLTQVLINLLANAIKFTEQGTVTVSAEVNVSSSTTLRITVKDTGIGMTETEMTHLFEPFVQANRSISTQYQGSGLGLAISKKLVEIMDGSIQVESQKNQGSSFSFTVRCESLTLEDQEKIKSQLLVQNKKEPAFSPVMAAAIKNKKILIVEDNEINQQVLTTLLEKQGCICFVANDGLEATNQYANQSFDLIFMDIEMPVMDGLTATKKIREFENTHQHTKTPIIGVSGYTRKEIEQSALAAGMDGYITKPYEREQIYTQIFQFTANIKAQNLSPLARFENQQRPRDNRLAAPQEDVIRLERPVYSLRNCCF